MDNETLASAHYNKNDYLIQLNQSYGTDSDVSSLPDNDIVSDNDEFVDAIQGHYLLRGGVSEFELESSSSSSENNDFGYESANDYGEADTEVEHQGKSDIEEEEDDNPPRSARRFRLAKATKLSNFATKLPFRKQGSFRSSGVLNVDFPKRRKSYRFQKKVRKNSFQQDLESASESTLSSKSYSVSTSSTFYPPAPAPTSGVPQGDFPTSFTSQHSNPLSSYFDSSLLENELDKNTMSNFYSEHAVFLRAVLQLLDEREKIGVEAAVDDPNTIKTGPLKKKMSLRRGKGGFGPLGWKMKYVEIRKGIFSYYENSKDSGGALLRKNLSLRTNICSCRSVPKMDLGTNGFVFELINESGRSTAWMSNSKEERSAWIRAINEGMIGRKDNDIESKIIDSPKSPTYRSSPTSQHRSPPKEKEDFERYIIAQKQIQNSRVINEYLTAFDLLCDRPLHVPYRLISKEQNCIGRVDLSQLWKQMSRESFTINDHVLRGDGAYGPERILGGLTRCILEYDNLNHGNVSNGDDLSIPSNEMRKAGILISELQAIYFSRDILASCSNSASKSLSCVEEFCSSPSLVLLLPSSAKASETHIKVSPFDPESESIMNIDKMEVRKRQDKCGWLVTRNKKQKIWRKLYCVLSEGVLSYYEKSRPRPHLLKGQFVLVKAKMWLSEVMLKGRDGGEEEVRESGSDVCVHYTIRLVTKNGSKERLFAFGNREEFFSWKLAIENIIDECSPLSNSSASFISERKEQNKSNEIDENDDRISTRKNFSEIFRATVHRRVNNNLGLVAHENENELARTQFTQHTKDANILSRLHQVNNNDSSTKIETDSRIRQLKKPLIQVLRGGNVASNRNIEDVSSFLKQQKPSVTVNIEASTLYKVCSVSRSELGPSDDSFG